jgi:hypothetical protein
MSLMTLRTTGLIAGLVLSTLLPGGSDYSPRMFFTILLGIAFFFSLVVDADNKRGALIAACAMSVFIILALPVVRSSFS